MKIHLRDQEAVEIIRGGVRIVIPPSAESSECCDEGCELLYYQYVKGVRYAVCDCGTHIQYTPCPE